MDSRRSSKKWQQKQSHVTSRLLPQFQVSLCQWLLSTTAMAMAMSMSMSVLECEGIHTEFQSFLSYCFGWNLKLQNLKFRNGFLHSTECPSYLLSMSYLLMFASIAGFLIQERRLGVFGSLIVIVFKSIFYLKKHVNDIFLYFKNYF